METTKKRQLTQTAHRQVRASTTLNRKYVKRPGQTATVATTATAEKAVKRSIKISHFSSTDTRQTATTGKKITIQDGSEIQPAEAHPTQVLANQKMRERQARATQTTAQVQRLTARELKDQAIKKALSAAEKQTTTSMAEQLKGDTTTKKQKRMKFGIGRVVLALSCTAAVVAGIAYFVHLNMPDIQFRAVAMQLNATYPNYLPYNYSPSEISSESGVITIRFRKATTEESFSIIEEKSSWDSNALLNNYVKEKYGDNYAILREQGLTIYVSGSNATWVNGGMVYKLEMKKGTLSKKQIADIAISF